MRYTYHCEGSGRRYHGMLRLRRELDRAKSGGSQLSGDLEKYGAESFSETLYSPDEAREKREVVIQMREDGAVVATFDSVEDAAKALGKKSSKYLAKEMVGDGRAYGFTWKVGHV